MKVTYQLDLGDELKGLSRSEKKEALEKVGNYLTEQILKDVSAQKSPVTGQRFSPLSPKYREFKKNLSSSPVPNLELHGDMLDALKFKTSGNSVEIGIFGGKNALKADNHNKFSEESKNTPLPPRKFIPNENEGEDFRPGIKRDISKLIEAEYGKNKTK